MKRSTASVFLISCLCVAALWIIFFLLNGTQPVLENGRPLSPSLYWGSRLSGWEEDSEGRTFTLVLEAREADGSEPDSYSLFLSRSPSRQLSRDGDLLTCNGVPLTPDPDNPLKYRLPPVREGQVLRLFLTDTQHNIYVANSSHLTRWLRIKENATWATVAVMLVLALYALVLFCCKPSEKYLLDFLLCQSLLLLWEVFRVLPDSRQTSYPGFIIGRSFTPLVAIASLKYSLRLANLTLPPWLEACLRWSCIPLWALAAYAISQSVPPLRAVTNTLLYLLCIAALSRTVAERTPGALWPLVGMILRMGLSPSILLLSLPAVSSVEGLLFLLLRNVHFIDIPFSLGIMIFANQKFARQFTESERLAHHLDELVAERTAQLKQLQSERQSMIMNITHDLRTPLFVVRSCLDTLEANPDSLPAMLPILKERSAFVSSLTEDLFLLVKLQEGKLVLSYQRECLSDILRRLMDSMQLEAEQKHIRLTGRLLPDLYVWGDGVRLQQIFQNLISNALHYTPEGGSVTVCMKLTEAMAAADNVMVQTEGVCSGAKTGSAEKAGFVTVSVRDSGKGISPADAEHIFERYFYTRSDNKHDSSGLGLSIARELTLLHHGDIGFANADGEGAEFFVALPLIEAEAE